MSHVMDAKHVGAARVTGTGGFTLIEILTVLLILGFFLGLAMAGMGGTARRAETRVASAEMHEIARAITGGQGAEAGFWADTGVLPEDRHVNPGRNEGRNPDGTSPFDPDRDDWIEVHFVVCDASCAPDPCCNPDSYINGNDYYYALSLRFLALSGGSGATGYADMEANYAGDTTADPWSLARDDANGIGFLSASDLSWDPVTARGWRGGAGEAYLAHEACPATQALLLPAVNSRGSEPPNGAEANLAAFKAAGWNFYIHPENCPPASSTNFVHEPGCRPVFLDPWGHPYQIRIPYDPLLVSTNDHHAGQKYRHAWLLSLGSNGRRDVRIAGPDTYAWDLDGDGAKEYNAVNPDEASHVPGKRNSETDDLVVHVFGALPDMIPEAR